jgi:hypothetical protein
MDRSARQRMAQRDGGRRKVGLATAAVAFTGTAAASVFGIALANGAAAQTATTTPTQTTQIPYSTNTPSQGHLQPPTQTPGAGSLGSPQAGSGGS